MNMFLRICLAVVFPFLLGCENKETEKITPKWGTNKSINLQKELVAQEQIEIKLCLAMHKDWEMITTSTGLMYHIYESPDIKDFAKTNDEVEVTYEISKLDGSPIYKTEEDEIKYFTVNKSDVESGVQELMQLVPVGAKVHVIVPMHLAHGLSGDMDQIPPLTPLVIDLEFIKIKK